MAVIKCKMCGGDLVIEPGATVAECEYCGSRQTVPNQDNEKKLTLFARANRLRLACEFDKAAGVYESIVAEFPQEAEAYWGLVLCKYGIEYVDDPATGKKIPTCHRSSFESVLDDSNFDQALENADVVARKVYREEAKQIEELRKKSETRRALDKAMDYLSLRDHAAGELYQKLCRKFDAHSAAYAVARAGELGLLNDAGFASRRAAELLRKRKSRREILNDLSAKGIDRDTAAEVVEELFAENDDGESPELETARALVARQYASKLAAGKRDQVAAALARRGFSHAVIREVLSNDE